MLVLVHSLLASAALGGSVSAPAAGNDLPPGPVPLEMGCTHTHSVHMRVAAAPAPPVL